MSDPPPLALRVTPGSHPPKREAQATGMPDVASLIQATLVETAREWPVGSGVMRRPLVPPPDRPNPTGPRRCGGPEHSAGLELEILWRARRRPPRSWAGFPCAGQKYRNRPRNQQFRL